MKITAEEMIEKVIHYANKNPVNRLRPMSTMEDLNLYIRHKLGIFFKAKGIDSFGEEDLCVAKLRDIVLVFYELGAKGFNDGIAKKDDFIIRF